MVTSFYARGDLHEAINGLGIPEPRMLSIFRGVAAALAHVHRVNVVHRDIKAENILLDGDEADRAILCDYGIACRTDDVAEMDRRCGSPGYAGPELLEGKKYGCEVDNFSSGVVLFFGLSGKLPFGGEDLQDIIENNKAAIVDIQGTPNMAEISGAAKNLVMGLLQKDPTIRLTAKCALEHEALSSGFLRPGTAQSGNFHFVVAHTAETLSG